MCQRSDKLRRKYTGVRAQIVPPTTGRWPLTGGNLQHP